MQDGRGQLVRAGWRHVAVKKGLRLGHERAERGCVRVLDGRERAARERGRELAEVAVDGGLHGRGRHRVAVVEALQDLLGVLARRQVYDD